MFKSAGQLLSLTAIRGRIFWRGSGILSLMFRSDKATETVPLSFLRGRKVPTCLSPAREAIRSANFTYAITTIAKIGQSIKQTNRQHQHGKCNKDDPLHSGCSIMADDHLEQ